MVHSDQHSSLSTKPLSQHDSNAYHDDHQSGHNTTYLKKILIIDEDKVSTHRLARGLSKSLAAASIEAHDIASARAMIGLHKPDYVVLEVKLGRHNGLDLIKTVLNHNPHAAIVFYTSFGSVASAVQALKLGARDYLTKSASLDEIDAALTASKSGYMPFSLKPLSADRAKWEHIQRIYELCGRNISQTARALSMHRRTLQRILSKKAPL